MRASWAGLLACALMAACSPMPTAQVPRPSGTLQPSVTASSADPELFVASDACRLLTSAEREALARIAMDAEVPVRAIAGTQECVWTHSLSEPARSAIRIISANGEAWARVAAPQILQAINHPATSKSLAKRLRKSLADLANSKGLTDERICEIYLEFTESRNMQPGDQRLYVGTIGSLPAVYAASCDQGTILMAGYGEYGLRGSIALNHAVLRLVDAASDRVAEVYGDADRAEAGEGEGGTDDAQVDEDGPQRAEPSPTQAGESDSENEDGADS